MSGVDDIRKLIADHKDGKLDQAPKLVNHLEPLIRITAGQVRAVCEANPEHPLSADKLRSVESLADDYPVHCDRADIDAMLEDKAIAFDTVTKGKQDFRVKKLVPLSKNRKPTAAVPPRPATIPGDQKPQ